MFNDEFNEFIAWLQAALNNPIVRSQLLQQPKKLQGIMNDIPARQWLFRQVRQTNKPDLAIRARVLLIDIMRNSRSIWCGGGNRSEEIYEEALSRTWEWFNNQLCQEYQPERASFVSWFNYSLRFRILDVIREQERDARRRLHLPADEENHEWIYPPAPDPDRWYETIQAWLELVQNHREHLRTCTMQRHPHVNCQFLLIHILETLRDSGDFSWDAVAQRYQVEPTALKRFCKTQCFPIFMKLLSD